MRDKYKTIEIKNLFMKNNLHNIYKKIDIDIDSHYLYFEQSIFFQNTNILEYLLSKNLISLHYIEKGLYLSLKKKYFLGFKKIFYSCKNFDLSFHNNLLLKYAIKKENSQNIYFLFIDFILKNNENIFHKTDILLIKLLINNNYNNIEKIFDLGIFNREQIKPSTFKWFLFNKDIKGKDYAYSIINYSINNAFKRNIKVITHLQELYKSIHFTSNSDTINQTIIDMKEYINNCFLKAKLEYYIEKLPNNIKNKNKI